MKVAFGGKEVMDSGDGVKDGKTIKAMHNGIGAFSP